MPAGAKKINLKIATAREEQLEPIWTNNRHGNLVDPPISVWRPQQLSPYRSLGDILVHGSSNRPDSVVCVIDDKSGSLCDPLTYQLVFCRQEPECAYRRSKPKYVHVWRAVPPLGFHALGKPQSVRMYPTSCAPNSLP